MTVFVPQVPSTYDHDRGKWHPRINVRNASPYGEVVELVPPHEVHAVMVTQPTLRRLRRELKDFGDGDYVLPVGDPTLVALTVAVALEMNRGRAKLLRWSRERREYDVVELAMYGES